MKFLFSNKRVHSTSFFDLSSRDKKKIIKKAVEESTEEQIKLLKRNGFSFSGLK